MIKRLVFIALIIEGVFTVVDTVQHLSAGLAFLLSDPIVVARGLVGFALFVGGWLFRQESELGRIVAPVALITSAVLRVFEIGLLWGSTDVPPGQRWPIVCAYGAYAVAAALFVRRSVTGPEFGAVQVSVPLASANVKRVMVVQLMQKAQHGASSLPLLFDGLRRVGEGDWHHWTFWLGAAELLIGALVVAGFLMAVRAIRRATPQQAIHHDTHAEHGPDWLDIFLAGMLAVEVLVHHEETGRWKGPTILTAVTTLGFGIFHGKLRARMLNRRSLKVAEGGLIVPGRFSAGLTASWPQLDRIDIGPDAAAIVTRRGRTHRLAFGRVLHAAALREALEVAQAKLAEYKKTTVHAATDPSALRDSSSGQQTKTH